MNRDDEAALDPADEAALVAFMRRVAEPPARASLLPTAASVLRQAEWRRRWEGERRMQRPLDIALPLQVAAGLAGLGLLLFRFLPQLLAMTLQSIR
jgi:hypothetical protein